MLLVTLLSCVTPPPASLEGAARLPAEGRYAGEPPGAELHLGEGHVGALYREANPGAATDLAMGGAWESLGQTEGHMGLDWYAQGHVWAVRCEDQRGQLPPTEAAVTSEALQLRCTLEHEAERWVLELRAEGDRPALGGLSMEGGAAYALKEVDVAPLQRPGPRQASWSLSLDGRSLGLIELRGEGALHLHPAAPEPELLEVTAATLLLWADPRAASP
ncbi:MAG: hypothetical protein H6741_07985 [Alphaproteobacteria bacterium]|nr:hypothetical protein [Alphaproteobacteria bacterium]MCB9792656.1 hypothetical protein [Alphaproteobacteria bacterium]